MVSQQVNVPASAVDDFPQPGLIAGLGGFDRFAHLLKRQVVYGPRFGNHVFFDHQTAHVVGSEQHRQLPDLQPRIQVGLLNILEEQDFQIRGFPIRMSLDLLIVFTANPEDYTNRGNIITPLKDRIEAQVLTHYPRTLEEGIAITKQEAWARRTPYLTAKASAVDWSREPTAASR